MQPDLGGIQIESFLSGSAIQSYDDVKRKMLRFLKIVVEFKLLTCHDHHDFSPLLQLIGIDLERGSIPKFE